MEHCKSHHISIFLFPGTTYDRSEYAQVTDFYTACMWYYEACLSGLSGAFLNFAMLIATEEIYSFTTLNGQLLTLAEAKKFIENKMAIGELWCGIVACYVWVC